MSPLQACARRWRDAARFLASFLPMIPVIGLLAAVDPVPASAAQCSPEDAARIAVSRYGGQALSVTADGDHFIVRLMLRDGQVVDVAVQRGSC